MEKLDAYSIASAIPGFLLLKFRLEFLRGSMETNNMLSVLDSYTLDNPDEIAKEIANDFRKRRIEKNLTREQVSEKAGVAVSNIVRFEQKGLISLKNLIGIAMALGYTSEIKNLFSEPKYSTMEELLQIRKNTNKKKVHK